MKRTEKTIVFAAIIYMMIYAPYFFFQLTRNTPPHFDAMIPLHFVGMLLNFVALATTFRDLYHRPFSDPNAKLTWCLLILSTGGIGWLVYIFKHALQPCPNEHVRKPSHRPTPDSESSVV